MRPAASGATATPRGGTLLITGATVLDGTGAPPRLADVTVTADRITAVTPPGTFVQRDGYAMLDATGLVLAPGFIDPHSHADISPLEREDDTSKILQGITTEVVGNCGMSPDPRPDGGFGGLFERLDAAGYVTHYCPLAGHQALYEAAMGGRPGPPDRADARRMGMLLDEAMEAGAFGMSSGLIYPPGVHTAPDELVELAARLPEGRIYATHMRDEGRHLRRSVEEAISLGVRTGRRVQVSHLKAAGVPFWGGVDDALDRLDRARAEGVDISQDVYPYHASSTTLLAVLPPWFLEGGDDRVRRRLNDPVQLERARAEVEDPADHGWENIVAGDGYDRIMVSSTRSHHHEGATLAGLGETLDMAPFEVIVHLLRTEDLQVHMVDFSMDERDVETVLRAPRTSVCTDGLAIGLGGKPHPRLYGSFPRVLGRYVRERDVLDLPTAIHKMTGLTAEVFGVPDRGRLAPGLVADLVAFDQATVGDTATYADPRRTPTGIRWVMQAGHVVVRDGRWLGTRCGVRLAPA
ncbi:amidohydrolase family protein [Streptomyces sp. NEAU-YJ-81]|uniref:N-acyl-D-amino-acid deacylase family protein n=1 Tax=Streptomyces sp. NEAU-YJ-81 TaxID=2820288 RepID=UPI0027E056DF|nr:amidohydrolase family protein [Streptomyces sp. NEAU-YJ-81]